MRSIQKLTSASIALVAMLILGQAGLGPAQAGGLFLYEVGTPDMYSGGAGWAARAQDAATVLTNPAGMTRLEGGDLIVGAGALYGDIEFTADENTTTDGGNGGVAVGWLPNGGVYFGQKASESVWFGIAATSNFGLSAQYEEDWVGRYYVQRTTLLGISLVPSVAWKLSEGWSLGASLNAMYGVLGLDTGINNLGPSEPDGQLTMDADDLGFGGNFGLLWERTEGCRFGITYTSPVQFDFTDRPEFKNLGPGLEAALGFAGLLDSDLGVQITVPQTVMASFYHELNDAWALMGDAGWQDWSRFGGVEMMIATDSPTSLTADLPYKDTWRGALGTKWRASDTWRLTAGVGYDSSMVEDKDRSLGLPVGATWRFAVGAQHDFSDSFDLGCGYTFAAMGSLPVDQERTLAGRVSGTYENAAIHVFSLQGHWRF